MRNRSAECRGALTGRLSATFVVLCCAASSLPAAEIVHLGSIEVTAQKRTEMLKDVAIPLTAYSGAFLEDTGINDYRTLAPLVPGLFVMEQSPNNPGINIRGITTDSGDPRNESRVSIFQDGVSINRSRGSVVELFDMERVEVLRGPQGTLFGRGAQIGAVSLVQNKAMSNRSGMLGVGIGTFGERRATGYYNTPLIPGQLYGRVAFNRRSHDGTVDNRADGSDLNGRDTTALRAAVRWQPTADTTADLIVNVQRDQPPGTAFKSATIPTSGGDTDPFLPAELSRGSRLGVNRTVGGVTAILEHRLNDRWTVSGTTGWREFDVHEHFDGDGSRLFLLELGEDIQGRQFSQEVRFNMAADRFAGFAGAGWFRETGTQKVPLATDERALWPWLSGLFRDGLIARGVPAPLANAAVPAMNPLLPQTNLPLSFAAFNNPALPASLRALSALAGAPLKPLHEEALINAAETSSLDLFADGTWQATGRMALTLGVRLTEERITSGYQVIDSVPAGMLGFITGATPNDGFASTGGRRLKASQSDFGMTGRAVVQYAFPADLKGYASISRGRRPAGLVLDATRVRSFKEETVWNYEAGFKQPVLGGRAYWQASAFMYEYAHFQSSVTDPSNIGRFIVIDAGNATGRGIELGFNGRVGDSVQMFTTYGYTKATFDDTGDNGQPQQYAGNTFRLTPKHTFAVGATADLTLAGRGTLSVTPVWSYRSRIYYNDNNASFGGRLKQEGYGILNLRATWRPPSRHWEVSASAENLLDEEYIVDAGNTGNDYGTPTYVPGLPRMLTLTTSYRW